MMTMEGSGINKTLAQQFFDDLAGNHMQVCDAPPEKSEQTMRIKVSSTPWVVPTTVDRRLAADGPETIIPKLQRLNQAGARSSSSPLAGISPLRSPHGGPLSPLADTPNTTRSSSSSSSGVSGGLDIYVALRPTSRDADLFEMPVHIVEDPSVLPIQPPAPVQEVMTRPSAAPAPFASTMTPFGQQPEPTRSIMATPGKQIFLKSPPPDPYALGRTSASAASAPSSSLFRSPQPGFLSPQTSSLLSPQQSAFSHHTPTPHHQSLPSQQPQSILLSPTRLSTAFSPPPSTTRKRVTFSSTTESTPSWSSREVNKPAPIKQSFLSPSPRPADYRY